jgi:hypothetical protein
MARTSQFSMRWWWGPLCSRPTHWVWIFIVLAHWYNSPRVDMSLHSDTLFWFRASQSFLFLHNAACLAEKQHIHICIVFGLTRRGLEPTIYRTRDELANHYATNAVSNGLRISNQMKYYYILPPWELIYTVLWSVAF